MKKPKLDVLIMMFCYGSNGAAPSILPEIAIWLSKRMAEMKADERIGRVAVMQGGDVPLTMIRNRVVKKAKDEEFDVILMIDSDNAPDLYLNKGEALPFWETSFNFLYERSIRGLPTVVCAPYCGPPPHPTGGGQENVYVFYVANDETQDGQVGSIRVESYTREHAALMRGIQAIAAGPTGCIVYSTDSFDLMPVHGLSDEQILMQFRAGMISLERTQQLLRMESWFFYEYTDQYQTQKASTEDVTNTREIQFAGQEKFGEPVVFCNWDAWAGHWKPKCVGRPQPLRIEQVSNVFAEAVRNNISAHHTIETVDFSGDEAGFDVPEKWDADEDRWEPTDAMELNDAVVDAKEVAGRQERVNGKPNSKTLKKEMRLGKVFENPQTEEHTLISMQSVIDAYDAKRTLVIGDDTSEIAYAIHQSSKWGVFSIGKRSPSHTPGHIKPIPGTPLEVAKHLPPQELDAVVIHSSIEEIERVARVWYSKHLKWGGVMVLIVDPMSDIDVASLLEGFTSAEQPHPHCESIDDGVNAIEKVKQHADV